MSERKVCCLERAHRDALRERMLSEQRLREELRQWKHHHPEVILFFVNLGGSNRYTEGQGCSHSALGVLSASGFVESASDTGHRLSEERGLLERGEKARLAHC